MRTRIKTVNVNGQFKAIETRQASRALWAKSVTCAKVTSQTVAGAEKSRRYRKPVMTEAQIAEREERRAKEARRKAFEAKWEEKRMAELFRGCNMGQTFMH